MGEVKYLSCDTLEWLVQDYYEDDNDHDIERFFSRFETLASWLESNEVKEKAKKTLLSYFDLERFTNNQLMSSVRKSKLFSESSILDVLSKSVTNLEDQIGKLRKQIPFKITILCLRISLLGILNFNTQFLTVL